MKKFVHNTVALGLLIGLTSCSSNTPTNETTEAKPVSEVRGERIVPLASEAPAEPEPASTLAAKKVSLARDTAPVAKRPAARENAEEEFIETNNQSYLSVGFDRLASFPFKTTDDILEAKGDPAAVTARTEAMIPDTIHALDSRSIALKGYMLPLKVEQGQVTEFLLMRDQSMCCYGTVPEINEWVSVVTTGGGLKPVIDEPVTIFGKLRVGEMRENGYLVGIYRMEGESLARALEL